MNEFVQTLISAYPNVPFQKLLGIEIVELIPDRVTVRVPFRSELVGGGQALHGGVMSSLLDLTGALAAWSGHDVSRGVKAATVSLTINYLSAAVGKDILATGVVRRRGKELIFCDVDIVDADGKGVASGSMIYRIV
jgi:uncharacterized protein (TIGR00369 family)